ncbi:hypothetical protein [Pseudonocardia lacus]|uniref:hypothetical protein n=1 Tax=Pseudonocardia lacus TaxID=2835865 RepID=UPI001BDBB74E|nr:hypothetical protein [Pseudonocardia lacus]
MSSPDYPMLVVPGHELYQLAHIATFIADAIARHRHAARGRQGRDARADAARDIAGGWAALDTATGATTPTSAADLPQPIDTRTFTTARELLTGGPRWADVASLATAGGTGWAVVGHVPSLGAVGARVGSRQLAEALRQHVMTQPAAALAPWAVTDARVRLPRVPDRVDLAAFVENLDPAQPDARVVARHLRGLDRRTDAAIRARFADVDLDAPLVVRPPAPEAGPETAPPGPSSAATASPAPVPRRPGAPQRPATAETGLRYICGVGPQPATARPPSAPASNAGP